jgi:outer membrane lipoprotein SlyB
MNLQSRSSRIAVGLLAVGSFALFVLTAWALPVKDDATAKAQWSADNKKAATQYEADKKLCADENDTAARLQCRRDAKSAYDHALAAVKASQKSAVTTQSVVPGCVDCGKVVAVSVTEKEGKASALGMVAGGVGGAILGHQVGGGVGKDLATVAGAVGGAYAGKKIEEKVRSYKVWSVAVEYPDASRKTFEFKQDPGYKVGDLVKNSGVTIARR